MINNERPLPQSFTSETTSQLSINCKMNGQTPQPTLSRHPCRPDPNLMENKLTFQALAFEGYGTEDKKVDLIYSIGGHVLGKGAFGTVYDGLLPKHNNRKVAIKQVIQDKRYRNRELPLMKTLKHCNIITLFYYFYHNETNHSTQKTDLILNLVLEYMPESLSSFMSNFKSHKIGFTIFSIKVLLYQIFRALSYMHWKGICHRDIKPNNLLFDPKTGVLKVCDFGSAKHLVVGEKNVSYICARYYRAPELLFGATDYTNMIDIWSVGVVFSELLNGQIIFNGNSGIDQLVSIIEKLGTPTKEQIKELNPLYIKYEFPEIKAVPLSTFFKANISSEAIDLLLKIFEYKPSQRIRALDACAHPFFDELRQPAKMWYSMDSFPKPRPLPPLFNFSEHELTINPSLNSILVPNHAQRLIGDGSATCHIVGH